MMNVLNRWIDESIEQSSGERSGIMMPNCKLLEGSYNGNSVRKLKKNKGGREEERSY